MTRTRCRPLCPCVLALGILLTLLAVPARAEAGQDVGEGIYRAGVLGSGTALVGVRQDDGQSVEGPAAACIHCHRESGLGSQEGTIAIPPIAGRYLFHPRTAHAAHRDLPWVAGDHPDRPAYTDETLARAIRDGVDPEGRPLGYLMPRFHLGEADMSALIAHLKTLAPATARGVGKTVLHFATIITPDADPVKRKAMLDVLDRYFAEKNTQPFHPAGHRLGQDAGGPADGIPLGKRHWQLHVWQLDGPPSGWEGQLQHYLAQSPVMAVVSGLGGSNWAPVHGFCQHTHLPCLFPNLEVPVEGDGDFYSLYFSRGVLLEAQLIARRIAAAAGDAATVQQVYRAGGSGEAAARALTQSLQAAGLAVEDRVLPAGPPGSGVRQVLEGLPGNGPVVLWLHGEDLAALAGLAPPARQLFASGLMGGLEQAPLPESWRERVLLSYPFDLPDRRTMRVDYPLGWFRIRNVPVVAEQVQVDTYLACALLADTLKQMADNAVPEYLVERAEDVVGQHVLTGYYPRLSLAQGQRFASKGGYLVQLSAAVRGRLSPAGDWVVP